MSPVQMESCGARREKGDPYTLEVYVYVCDKDADHVARGDTYHEGAVEGGSDRLGWPATMEERKAVA